MPRQKVYIWKQAPFLRLIIPFISGIIIQWYIQLPVQTGWSIIIISFAGLIVFNLRLSFLQFRFVWANGVFIHTLLLSLGLLIAYYKDISHQSAWVNNYYHDKAFVTAVLQEPLSEKTNSIKAVASIEQVFDNSIARNVKGNIILYFQKDSAVKNLSYGSRILFNKSLQPVKNSGNPGSFNYRQYAAFQGIYQQVYLKPGEFIVLPVNNENVCKKFLFDTREKVLHIITTYIPGEKEAGLAEALLIGYKDDLDKTLIQSYSNTGVVHVVAISGLHLGLIYWLLSLLLRPLKKRKSIKWLRPLLIISGLWLFALLAGGGPSILRSAVMFTCIVVGESMARKTFIYNSLAASAFLLLCINPFWLWDVGFQLSYMAVLSIVIFMQPIYHCFYFNNKIIDTIWKLNAVTLAAQILTIPISIYHFHQFPNYFLLTNILAVPLSSLIVLGEILLCAIAFIPLLAKWTGLLLQELIRWMNGFIEHMESLPFSLWDGMQVNILQLILLYGVVACITYWLFQKNKTALIVGLACMLGFIILRTRSFIDAGLQQQLIVYNVPRHQAIDFINGRDYIFSGDKELLEDDFLQNFHLKPSRVLHRVNPVDSMAGLSISQNYFVFNNKKIVLVNETFKYDNITGKIQADIIIVSKNPRLYISDLSKAFDCRQIIFDGSNPQWKVNKWQVDCAKLGLACYSVVDKGAFVMKMD